MAFFFKKMIYLILPDDDFIYVENFWSFFFHNFLANVDLN